jgi:hypothetical protein
LNILSNRAPKCFHTRGDEIRKTAPVRPRLATALADWAAAPRPHKISYVPLADRTLIFLISFAQQRLKNVTQLFSYHRRERECIRSLLMRRLVMDRPLCYSLCPSVLLCGLSVELFGN